jgi:hypothetical protein
MHQNAHRFTVLIPTNPAEDRSVWLRRLAQADQVVRQERPAHADFEVTPYWALFQVGSARLGLDTAIGEGSRFVSVVLGATALSAGALQGGHPWDVQDRRIVGRDSIWRDRRRTQP